MTQEELDKVIEEHGKWLRGDGGKRAVLDEELLDGMNLDYANLDYASLYHASLNNANLYGSSLDNASLDGAILPQFQIPQTGTLDVYKKAGGKIVKLRIPAKAKRTANLVGRKCRAEYVKVLDIDGGGPVFTDGYGHGPLIHHNLRLLVL